MVAARTSALWDSRVADHRRVVRSVQRVRTCGGAEGLACFVVRCLCLFEHLSIGKAIPDVDVRQQVHRPGRVVLDLFAQLANKRAQVLNFFATVGTPYSREEAGISDNAPGTAHQAMENIEFLARKM